MACWGDWGDERGRGRVETEKNPLGMNLMGGRNLIDFDVPADEIGRSGIIRPKHMISVYAFSSRVDVLGFLSGLGCGSLAGR